MADNPERSAGTLENFYDYTKDARFESMWDYPRRTHLYRKHKDLRAECERKLKYYQRNQSIFCAETQRQQQIVWDRFSRLQKHTIEESTMRSDSPKFSYNTFRDVPKRKESLIVSIKSLKKSNEGISHRRSSQLNNPDNSRTSLLNRTGRRRSEINIPIGSFQREENLMFSDVGDQGQKKNFEEASQPQSSKQQTQQASQQDNDAAFNPIFVRSLSSVGVPMKEMNTTDLSLRRSATTLQKEVLRFLSEGPDNYKSPFRRRKN
ncbi:hypothetical protein CHS0354_022478 [Potamilus streckersoni]|uniref:Uncharacterized protein n=1 Tax=Potamilus streckersoni TaxID=2493646 RepID=A0AAE0W482_9BIVA|nr:hypothetical protein CHS0354_022478 [Potamilus streckersoni]